MSDFGPNATNNANCAIAKHFQVLIYPPTPYFHGYPFIQKGGVYFVIRTGNSAMLPDLMLYCDGWYCKSSIEAESAFRNSI